MNPAQFAHPQPSYVLSKDALKNVLGSDEDSVSSYEDTEEIGRGDTMQQSVTADSRHKESVQSENPIPDEFRGVFSPLPAVPKGQVKQKKTRGSHKDANARLSSIGSEKENVDPVPQNANDNGWNSSTEAQTRKTLATLHSRAQVGANGSNVFNEAPPTFTINSTKSTRFNGGNCANVQPLKSKMRQKAPVTEDGQSFVLPDMNNMSDLVTGNLGNEHPISSGKMAKPRVAFTHNAPTGSPIRYIVIDGVAVPFDEEAIIASLRKLEEKMASLQLFKDEAGRRLEHSEAARVHAEYMIQDKMNAIDREFSFCQP